MNQRLSLITGSLLGGSGVALGAFGAHALKPMLEANGRLDTFELAVRYQFYHAFALLICGLLMNHLNPKHLARATSSFAAGVLFFSGSLYALSFTGIKILGAITPVGGVFFILGWIFLLVAVSGKHKDQIS